MDIEALESALDGEMKVRLLGQTFTLQAPSLAAAAKLARTAAVAARDAPEDSDTRYDAFIAANRAAVKACLVDDVPDELVERIIVRTGVMASPLVAAARTLCGMDPVGDEEDPDPDLPT